MNNKQYIGKRAGHFESHGEIRAVDGIALIVDEDNEFRAGDQTGYVMEITCPYGSQAMADALLAQLQGKTYTGYTVANAVMDPAAELGDGVTVGGIYSLLASRQMVLGSGHLGQISAPADSEMDHEYGVDDTYMRQIDRKIAGTRSYIDKKSDEVRIGVESLVDERASEIDVQLESITGTVTGLGSRVSTVEQTAERITSTVKGLGEDMSSIEQRMDNIRLKVTGSLGGEASITLSGGGGGSGTIDLSGVRDAFANDTSNITIRSGTVTFATGKFISTGSNFNVTSEGFLTAKSADLKTVTLDGTGGSWTGGGSEVNNIAAFIQGNMFLFEDGSNPYSYTLYGVTGSGRKNVPLIWASHDPAYFGGEDGTIVGYNNNVYVKCGTNTFRVDRAPSTGSDRDIKRDIAAMDEKYLRLLDAMRPVTFRFQDEEADAPLHAGYIAQEMEQALYDAGMDRADAASLIGKDGTRTMGITYEEIIPMLHLKIKDLETRLRRLEERA